PHHRPDRAGEHGLDELVREGRVDGPEGLREDDLDEGHPPGEAEGGGGVELPLRDGLQPAPDDLRDVGAVVHGEGDDERPQRRDGGWGSGGERRRSGTRPGVSGTTPTWGPASPRAGAAGANRDIAVRRPTAEPPRLALTATSGVSASPPAKTPRLSRTTATG